MTILFQKVLGLLDNWPPEWFCFSLLKPLHSKIAKKEWTPINPWLIHVNVWQNPLQYYKVISLQVIKINGKKKNELPHPRHSIFDPNKGRAPGHTLSLPVTSLYGLSSMTYTLQDLWVVKSCCSKSPMVSCWSSSFAHKTQRVAQPYVVAPVG